MTSSGWPILQPQDPRHWQESALCVAPPPRETGLFTGCACLFSLATDCLQAYSTMNILFPREIPSCWYPQRFPLYIICDISYKKKLQHFRSLAGYWFRLVSPWLKRHRREMYCWWFSVSQGPGLLDGKEMKLCNLLWVSLVGGYLMVYISSLYESQSSLHSTVSNRTRL